MKHSKYMRISELSKASGIPNSTIRYYVREGLLQSPARTGKTMAYYNLRHLERLQLIKKIQHEEELPLKFIKEMIERMEGENSQAILKRHSRRRDVIIDSAITLFREKGYANTSITDIVEYAHIGRGTFYLNFTNKEELFIECADKIFFAMYDDVWQEIKNEQNMVERLGKRWLAFYRSYPRWRDMMNLIRAAAVGEHPPLAEKLEQVMHQIIDPIIRDIQRGMQQGSIRQLDPKLAGFMLMGIAEYCAYLLYEDKTYNPEEISAKMWDIIDHGVKK